MLVHAVPAGAGVGGIVWMPNNRCECRSPYTPALHMVRRASPLLLTSQWSLHVQPAVNSEDLPCDIGRVLGQEEFHHFGYLVGLPYTSHGDLSQYALPLPRTGV